jgi:hypothetical protein
MNIGTALGLAEKSMGDFDSAIKDMKFRELYELTDDLRFVDNNPVFSAVKKFLQKRLSAWHDQVKKWEKGSKGDTSYGFIYFETYNLTGFEVFNAQSPEFNPDIIPSEYFKSLINNISSW